MSMTLAELGDLVKSHRDHRRESQDEVAAKSSPPTNRSVVAHLEQGLRVPEPEQLKAICEYLRLPEKYWTPFLDRKHEKRLRFEEAVGELTGQSISLGAVDTGSETVARDAVDALFARDLTPDQTLDAFNSVLVYYGVRPVSPDFFAKYLGRDAFKSSDSFLSHVREYQEDAIRLFSTFALAYEALSSTPNLTDALRALDEHSEGPYFSRSSWEGVIDTIEDSRLALLGYISSRRVRTEHAERETISRFLRELAANVRKSGKPAVQEIGEKKRRQMDSLLRKFESNLQHGLLSPLFIPDADQLEREATLLAPKEESELARLAETEARGQRNLSRYLAADFMDVYAATSMRSDADFISVNNFVTALFGHEEIRPLKMRYFNPTQSWIDDRVAKGIVEALMLRRCRIAIYMAQKDDTFGKDSEASVALGQGKPVIVYVPKLVVPEVSLDSEVLGRKSKTELRSLVSAESPEEGEFDDSLDEEALLSKLLTIRLRKATPTELALAARSQWADFDLYSESVRIVRQSDTAAEFEARASYRKWLDEVTGVGRLPEPPVALRDDIVGILVANAIRFEKRAQLFREHHPLALQVILSTGVLNGMIVVRSVDSCAYILRALIRNKLESDLVQDEKNYRLIERTTRSTMRVISRHRLIANAFQRFYRSDNDPV